MFETSLILVDVACKCAVVAQNESSSYYTDRFCPCRLLAGVMYTRYSKPIIIEPVEWVSESMRPGVYCSYPKHITYHFHPEYRCYILNLSQTRRTSAKAGIISIWPSKSRKQAHRTEIFYSQRDLNPGPLGWQLTIITARPVDHYHHICHLVISDSGWRSSSLYTILVRWELKYMLTASNTNRK